MENKDYLLPYWDSEVQESESHRNKEQQQKLQWPDPVCQMECKMAQRNSGDDVRLKSS